MTTTRIAAIQMTSGPEVGPNLEAADPIADSDYQEQR